MHNFKTDLISGIKLLPAVVYISQADIQARYRRSVLGPLWLVVTLGFGSIGIGVLWSILWQLPLNEMLPSITVGFLVWIFISTSINDGVLSFTNNGEALKNVKLPICFFPILSLSRNLVNFIHSFLIIVAICFIFPPSLSWVQLMIPVGIVISVVSLFFIIYLLAFVSARFRDLQPLVQSVVPLLFFLSPVLFKLEQAPELKWVMLFNPLTYYVSIIRDPILGTLPSLPIYLGAISIGFLSFLTTKAMVDKKLNSLVHWV